MVGITHGAALHYLTGAVQGKAHLFGAAITKDPIAPADG
jgi:hypothetical protein